MSFINKFFGIFFFIIGALVLLFSVGGFGLIKDKTSATIDNVKIDYYMITFNYSYEFNGKTYNSTDVVRIKDSRLSEDSNVNVFDRLFAKSVIREGKVIDVYLNKSNPRYSRADIRHPVEIVCQILFSGLFFVASIYIFRHK